MLTKSYALWSGPVWGLWEATVPENTWWSEMRDGLICAFSFLYHALMGKITQTSDSFIVGMLFTCFMQMNMLLFRAPFYFWLLTSVHEEELFSVQIRKKEMWRPHKQPFFLILLIKTLFFISPLSHKLICYLLQHLLDYAYISDLTMATKCSRFMPGLLALVSASFSSDEIRKPAAFPAYPPWVATYKVRITQNTHTQHVTALIKQWDKTQVHSQSDVPENTRPAPVGNWHIIHG